jgi:hypothetical protein
MGRLISLALLLALTACAEQNNIVNAAIDVDSDITISGDIPDEITIDPGVLEVGQSEYKQVDGRHYFRVSLGGFTVRCLVVDPALGVVYSTDWQPIDDAADLRGSDLTAIEAAHCYA